MVDINGKQRKAAKEIHVQIARTVRQDSQPNAPRTAWIIAEHGGATPWRRWGGRLNAALGAALLIGVGLPTGATASHLGSCDTFRDVVLTETGPLRATSSLTRGEPLVIVSIGSSSTEGVGASTLDRRYPAMLQRFLRERFPRVDIVVHNRGVGGQSADQMLARFDADLWPHKPQLVLWQTGTIEALRHTDPAVLIRNLEDGIGRIRQFGAEVILINQQYSRNLDRRHPDYARYVDAMRDFARAAGVPLVDRYTAMRRQFDRLSEAEFMGPDGMLAADRLHHNDEGYRCVAQTVADFIACGRDATCRDGRLTAERAGGR